MLNSCALGHDGGVWKLIILNLSEGGKTGPKNINHVSFLHVLSKYACDLRLALFKFLKAAEMFIEPECPESPDYI